MPVKFMPRPWKAREEAAHATRSVLVLLADFADPVDDSTASEDDIVEENTSCVLRDLTY